MIGKSDHPLILHGASGCGKTSLMAKAASQVRPYYLLEDIYAHLFSSSSRNIWVLLGCTLVIMTKMSTDK